MHRAPSLLAFSTVMFATTMSAHATIMVRRSIDDLTRDADVVAVATAGGAHASWSDGHIVTDVSVQLDRVVRGTPEASTVTVRLPGGMIGDVGQRVEGAASLEAGNRYVLFLHRDVPGRYFTVSMSQGVLPVQGGVRVMPAPASGATVVDRAATPAVFTVPAEGMALEMFVQHVMETSR